MKKSKRKTALRAVYFSFIFMLSLPLTYISCSSTENIEVTPPSVTAAAEEAEKVQEKAEVKAADLYKEKTAGLKISVLSAPNETTKGKAFSHGYILKVTAADGSAVKDLELTAEDPFGSKAAIVTKADGTVTYTPAVPDKSVNGTVRFYPAFNEEDAEIKEEADKIAVEAPFKVQTNLKQAGGVIAVVDLSKTEKPVTSNPVSSSNLLMELMKLGFSRIGNIDLTNEVLNGDTVNIQKKAKSMVGNSAAFVIYGTVRYKSCVKNPDGTTTVSLTGNLGCLDLKTGYILYEDLKESSSTSKSETTALRDARKILAYDFAQGIKYGI